MSIILHIDMNSYFASCEQQANPHLRGVPVGVCEHLGGIIIAPSVEAKRAGIRLGTPVWEAVKICPRIVLLDTDPPKYRQVTERWLGILKDYAEAVEQASIDEAFLDLTLHPLLIKEREGERWNNALLLALEIKQRLRLEVGEWVSASIGIGPNKLLAKIAADLGGGIFSPLPIPPPQGEGSSLESSSPWRGEGRWGCNQLDRICVIRPENIPQLYNYLKLTDVPGIGKRLERALQKLGIFTLRELAGYPLENLLNQFGVTGFWLHELANFRDHDLVIAEDEQPKSFGHVYTVPKALTSETDIRKLMLKLSEKVARRMRGRGAQGSTVHYFHSDKQGQGFSRQRKGKDFINDGKDIYKIAWQIFCSRPRPAAASESIKIIGVSVSGLNFSGSMTPLFEQYKKPAWLVEAMDKINDKYGEFAVYRGRLIGAPQDWAKDTVGFSRTR